MFSGSLSPEFADTAVSSDKGFYERLMNDDGSCVRQNRRRVRYSPVLKTEGYKRAGNLAEAKRSFRTDKSNKMSNKEETCARGTGRQADGRTDDEPTAFDPIKVDSERAAISFFYGDAEERERRLLTRDRMD